MIKRAAVALAVLATTAASLPSTGAAAVATPAIEAVLDAWVGTIIVDVETVNIAGTDKHHLELEMLSTLAITSESWSERFPGGGDLNQPNAHSWVQGLSVVEYSGTTNYPGGSNGSGACFFAQHATWSATPNQTLPTPASRGGFGTIWIGRHPGAVLFNGQQLD